MVLVAMKMMVMVMDLISWFNVLLFDTPGDATDDDGMDSSSI